MLWLPMTGRATAARRCRSGPVGSGPPLLRSSRFRDAAGGSRSRPSRHRRRAGSGNRLNGVSVWRLCPSGDPLTSERNTPPACPRVLPDAVARPAGRSGPSRISAMVSGHPPPSGSWVTRDRGALLPGYRSVWSRMPSRSRLSSPENVSVHQQDPRRARGAGKRDPLLLAAGKLVGIAPGMVPSADRSSSVATRRRSGPVRSAPARPKPTFSATLRCGTARNPETSGPRRAL